MAKTIISESAEYITPKEYTLRKIPIKDLKFDKSNPNILTDEQVKALKKSFKEFGYLVPIIVNEKMQIGDGEHRALIYKEMKIKEIPAYVVPKLNNDIKRRLLRQTMNKLRGQHDTIKDIDELSKILQANQLGELAELIAQEKSQLEILIQTRDDVAPEKIVQDKPVSFMATENKCPKCGYTW